MGRPIVLLLVVILAVVPLLAFAKEVQQDKYEGSDDLLPRPFSNDVNKPILEYMQQDLQNRQENDASINNELNDKEKKKGWFVGSTEPTCEDVVPSIPFCNWTLPVDVRVKDALSRMTPTEKIAQLDNQAPGIPRLGITSYNYWSEALHGVLANGTTSFPQVIGIGAAFNMTFVLKMAQTISNEGRALFNIGRYPPIGGGIGGLTFWSPNINIFRDPRWGRGQETPGEDPYLSSAYARNFVRGLQEGIDPRYTKVLSTCKHYAAYDLEDWHGVDRYHFNAIVNDRDLVETYLPSFEACVRESRVGSVMCSYNAVNGIPSCANDFILQEIMRDEWGFDGYIVSDCDAISDILYSHNYTHNISQTCQVALRAGCDLDCGDTYGKCGVALQDGSINVGDLDRAVGRMLKQRVLLGMFDPPEMQPYRKIGGDAINTTEAQQLALEGARQSMVLLKNSPAILPLAKNLRSLAVIGPNAADAEVLLGNYHGYPSEIITILEGISNTVSPNTVISYAPGCMNITCENTSNFATALKYASAADAVIMVMGINQDIESEGNDRTVINLPPNQLTLIQLIRDATSRLVLVLVNGGSISEPWIKANVPAILEAFYPGERGGQGVADVLFGDYNPGGRLPYTVYPADYVNQLPMTNMDMTAYPGRTYKYYQGQPIWKFGDGLSYTTFSYSVEARATYSKESTSTSTTIKGNRIVAVEGEESVDSVPHPDSPGSAVLPSLRVSRSLAIDFRVNVTNTGSKAGSDVVLAFVTPPPNPDSPIRRLFGFERVFLQPGETTQVFFSTSPTELAIADSYGHRYLHPGAYKIEFGDREKVEMTLRGTERILIKAWRGSNKPPFDSDNFLASDFN